MIGQLVKNKDQDFEEKQNKMFGVVTAIVTNTKDPDKMGRVKVKYAWMGEAKTIESDWARVVSFMAGNERGAHFLPDVDDEVLISFEHGNMNHPYIIGALYSTKDKVIEKNEDGKNNIKMIKSRSGHTITLDDTSGKEKFIIEDKSGKRSITFDAKEKTLDIVNSEGDMTISVKGDLTIKSEKKLTLEGKTGVDINSDSAINIEGKSIKAKSSAALNIEAGSSLTAKASAGTTVQAGSSLSLKGSASAKLEGPKVDVKASAAGSFNGGAKLDLKASGMATLDGGGLTTVKGGIVKVN